MFNIVKKEDKFFDMFIEVGDIICDSANIFKDLINNYSNLDGKIGNLEKKEHECDDKVHEIMETINKSFITPIDREDINLIAKELDNIVDSIESAAHRFSMFKIKTVKKEVFEMADLIVKATFVLKGVLAELQNMKKSTLLTEKIIEVNRLEGEGDKIFRKAIKNLFAEEKDPIEIIKWKEIFEFLENTLDTCEDVANTIEGVVTKHV